MFFYDHCGGIAIGGLFNPSLVSKERAFRIALDFPTRPGEAVQSEDIKSRQNVHLDRNAFLDRLVSMSDGLVERVTKKE